MIELVDCITGEVVDVLETSESKRVEIFNSSQVSLDSGMYARLVEPECSRCQAKKSDRAALRKLYVAAGLRYARTAAAIVALAVGMNFAWIAWQETDQKFRNANKPVGTEAQRQALVRSGITVENGGALREKGSRASVTPPNSSRSAKRD